jgi:PRTRC genetic system protein A
VTVNLVEYLVARHGVPFRKGLAFDYVLAGDGVYLAAENDDLQVRVPIAECNVRGLPPVYPACSLKHGRMPSWIWNAIVWAAHVGYLRGREVLLEVTFDSNVGYRLTVPPQLGGPERVIYRPTATSVLEIHSHGSHAAFFSSIDDHDEQGLRLYGVIGRLGTERPEFALRVGAYGHFLSVPWETVFDGDQPAFHDALFDPVPQLGLVDAVRD